MSTLKLQRVGRNNYGHVAYKDEDGKYYLDIDRVHSKTPETLYHCSPSDDMGGERLGHFLMVCLYRHSTTLFPYVFGQAPQRLSLTLSCHHCQDLIFLCKVSKVGRTQSTALLFGKNFTAAFRKS